MLHRFLRGAAEEDPDRVALTYQGAEITYGEIEQRANSVAARLIAEGLGPGGRAAVIISNRPEWIVCTQAVLKTGAAVVTPMATWTVGELTHALELTTPDVVIVESLSGMTLAEVELAAVRLSVDDDTIGGWTSIREAADSRSDASVSTIVDSDDDAFMLFSSGTTGLPKAVRHSHASMSAAVEQWVNQAGLGGEDRVQFFMPACTIFGMATTLSCFSVRARISFFQRFDLEVMLDDIQSSRITVGMAAAPVAVAMASHPELERFDLSSLRYLIWGATPIVKAIAEKVSRRSGVRWLHTYGTSEHGQLACNPVAEPERWRLDSPGIMSPDGEYRFAAEDGTEVPPHTPGELWVRSPQTMTGYLPEEANEDVMVDGWVRTGDIGFLDGSGFLYLVDRAKEMIKVSGFAVSPVEIERTLFKHPDVDDCGVYPIDDPQSGQRPAAAVVRRAGASVTPQQLIDWIKPQLSGYKRLGTVTFVESIPRNASGKIHRRRLSDVVEGAAASSMGPAS